MSDDEEDDGEDDGPDEELDEPPEGRAPVPKGREREARRWIEDGALLMGVLLAHRGLASAFRAGSFTPAKGRTAAEILIDDSRELFEDQGEKLVEGGLSVGAWAAGMAEEIGVRTAASGMALIARPTLGRGLWPALVERVDGQRAYLAKFRAKIRADPKGVGPWVPARASLYADALWGGGHVISTETAKIRGYRFAKRILGTARHCQDCGELADRGWVPIDELTPIGDTACGARCHCTVIYK